MLKTSCGLSGIVHAFVGMSVVAGCASKQFAEVPRAAPVVPITSVINTLKCGLSNAMQLDALGRSGIVGSVADIQLDVDVVESVTAEGSISAGIPIATGATISPSLSASSEQTLTNNTTINFSIAIEGYNQAACAAVGGHYQDAGFSSWLGQVVRDINLAVAGPPYASIASYSYDSHFIVKKGVSAGVDFEIVPVKLGASVDSTRSDIQHIVITIDAVHFESGKKKAKKPHGPNFAKEPFKTNLHK